ncbi:MAG: phage holin family protein [Chitinophagaceae bacterium]|nr:phage holin family protein [Chitinophagaceae bacterium]
MNKSGENTEHQNAPTVALEDLFHKATDYVETRVELARLKAVEKSADAASTMYAGMVVLLIAFLFIILLNIGLAILIGEYIGEIYLGFFILAGLYALTGLVFYFNRNTWLKTPVNNRIIKKILGN